MKRRRIEALEDSAALLSEIAACADVLTAHLDHAARLDRQVLREEVRRIQRATTSLRKPILALNRVSDSPQQPTV